MTSKRRKATKRNVDEESDHELPGAKLRVVLHDSEEEDHSGGGWGGAESWPWLLQPELLMNEMLSFVLSSMLCSVLSQSRAIGVG